ncbi:hypothetical protein QBC39DRAFT_312743 [Podospora conica]|nr:hypothetical protein QBC39DRAFT_312743 [Schizothecium conicum]
MSPWPLFSAPASTPPFAFNSSALLLPRASCTLTPSASAFSAILSAFIGSVINGLASGWVTALATGWISWLAIFRVLLGATYMLRHSLFDTWGPGPPPDSPSTSAENLHNIPLAPSAPPPPLYDPPPPYANPHSFRAVHALQASEMRTFFSFSTLWPSPSIVRGAAPPRPVPAHWASNAMLKPRLTFDRSVTVLGWFSWAYTAVFAPVTQILFLAANWSRPGLGAAKLVKGLTIAVTALPLCVDVRVRYGERLGRGWMRVGFNVVTAGSCLVQGVFCGLLLGQGVVDLGGKTGQGREGGFPSIVVIAVPVYLLFAAIWAMGSCLVLPMRDGGRREENKLGVFGYLRDVGAGAFAGIFLAWPAVMLYFGALGGGQGGAQDLRVYLSCESQVWRKMAAVLP